MIRYPSNVSLTTESSNQTNYNNSGGNNDTSIITYDNPSKPLRLGGSYIKHLIRKVLVSLKHYGCMLQSDVFNINT